MSPSDSSRPLVWLALRWEGRAGGDDLETCERMHYPQKEALLKWPSVRHYSGTSPFRHPNLGPNETLPLSGETWEVFKSSCVPIPVPGGAVVRLPRRLRRRWGN